MTKNTTTGSDLNAQQLLNLELMIAQKASLTALKAEYALKEKKLADILVLAVKSGLIRLSLEQIGAIFTKATAKLNAKV
jgi:hypothetical protein